MGRRGRGVITTVILRERERRRRESQRMHGGREGKICICI
jgi:hypothetical protein